MSLADMLKEQEEFNRLLGLVPADTADRIRLTKEFLLHLIAEADELLAATGSWKIHRAPFRVPRPRDIAEEIVDMMKYLLNIAYVWEIDASALEQMFLAKSTAVRAQLEYERRLKFLASSRAPVVVLDVDGTLNDFPCVLAEVLGHRCDQYLTMKYKVVAERGLKEYEAAKLEAVRKGETFGAKAAKVMKGLKDMGYKVVLVTRRNLEFSKQLRTRLLCEAYKMGGLVDAVAFASDKAEVAVSLNTVVAVDDEPDDVESYLRAGVRAIMVEKPYNKEYARILAAKGATIVDDVEAVPEVLVWLRR